MTCMVIGTFSKKISQKVARAWSRNLLYFFGVKVIVKGQDRLARGARYVFFANHQSALDIPILYAALLRPLCFIAKKELFMVPILGWGMAAIGHVRIDRSSPRKALDSLARGVDNLNRHGLSLVLFPEGTRSDDGTLGRFKQGSFALALDAGMPVVPVAIRKANERLPKKELLVRPGNVYVEICDPIDPAGMDKSGLADRVRTVIEKTINSADPLN